MDVNFNILAGFLGGLISAIPFVMLAYSVGHNTGIDAATKTYEITSKQEPVSEDDRDAIELAAWSDGWDDCLECFESDLLALIAQYREDADDEVGPAGETPEDSE